MQLFVVSHVVLCCFCSSSSAIQQPDGESQPLIPVYFTISTNAVKVIHRVDDVRLFVSALL